MKNCKFIHIIYIITLLGILSIGLFIMKNDTFQQTNTENTKLSCTYTEKLYNNEETWKFVQNNGLNNLLVSPEKIKGKTLMGIKRDVKITNLSNEPVDFHGVSSMLTEEVIGQLVDFTDIRLGTTLKPHQTHESIESLYIIQNERFEIDGMLSNSVNLMYGEEGENNQIRHRDCKKVEQ